MEDIFKRSKNLGKQIKKLEKKPKSTQRNKAIQLLKNKKSIINEKKVLS